MLYLFDYKKIDLNKTLLWSTLIHLIILLISLIPSFSLKTEVAQTYHPVKLIQIPTPVSKPKRRSYRKNKTKKKKNKQKSVDLKPKQIAPQQTDITPTLEPLEKEPIITEEPSPQVSVETSRFKFTYYLDIIKHKIMINWLPNTSYFEPGTKINVKVRFRIKRQGEIDSISITESSVDEAINQTAVEAVKAAMPMPPLPELYDEDYLIVNFHFFLKVTHDKIN